MIGVTLVKTMILIYLIQYIKLTKPYKKTPNNWGFFINNLSENYLGLTSSAIGPFSPLPSL